MAMHCMGPTSCPHQLKYMYMYYQIGVGANAGGSTQIVLCVYASWGVISLVPRFPDLFQRMRVREKR